MNWIIRVEATGFEPVTYWESYKCKRIRGNESSGDVVHEKAEITKIHKFEFLSADVAMCVFTLGQNSLTKELLVMICQP